MPMPSSTVLSGPGSLRGITRPSQAPRTADLSRLRPKLRLKDLLYLHAIIGSTVLSGET